MCSRERSQACSVLGISYDLLGSRMGLLPPNPAPVDLMDRARRRGARNFFPDWGGRTVMGKFLIEKVRSPQGLTNLESVTDFILINRRNYKQCQEELAGLEGMTLLAYDEERSCTYRYVVLEIERSSD